MPYYETSQEWLRQTSMLLEARPTTTRITTTYRLTSKSKRSKKSSDPSVPPSTTPSTTTATPATATTTTTTTPTPRGILILKSYDPNTGVCLKYRTRKAAEVSRLILTLGQLGRTQAALPSEKDVVMGDAAAAATVAEDEPAAAKVQTQTQTQGGNGGKGKKKRGKK